jgi:dipeptidyl aminopeptidase/acylaminoacyl peptidase
MQQQIIVLSLAGASEAHSLNIEGTVGRSARAFDIAADGKYVVVVSDDRGRGRLHFAALDGGPAVGSLELLLPDPQVDIDQPRLSPDGRLIAYVVFDSGQPEIFLSRFPEGTGRWQVSRDGGRNPAWAESGELFFIAGSGPTERTMASVTVDPARNLVADAPVTLFSVDIYDDKMFDVSADGQRFLLVRRSGTDRQAVRRMILVQNWQSRFAP